MSMEEFHPQVDWVARPNIFLFQKQKGLLNLINKYKYKYKICLCQKDFKFEATCSNFCVLSGGFSIGEVNGVGQMNLIV